MQCELLLHRRKRGRCDPLLEKQPLEQQIPLNKLEDCLPKHLLPLFATLSERPTCIYVRPPPVVHVLCSCRVSVHIAVMREHVSVSIVD